MSSIFRNSSTRSSMAAKFALINTRGRDALLNQLTVAIFVFCVVFATLATLYVSSALAMLCFFFAVDLRFPLLCFSFFVCKDSGIDFLSSFLLTISLRLKFYYL